MTGSTPIPTVVATPRLRILAAPREALLADLESPARLAAVLGVPVAPDWPPQHWDSGPLRWLLDKLDVSAGEPFWWAWYLSLPAEGGLVVGTAGFKGPPDVGGFVEIGYSIVTSRWRRGLATEAVAGLLAWAASSGRVSGFRAHTLADDPASGGVLLKNGFARVLRLSDPEDGEVDRYERPV